MALSARIISTIEPDLFNECFIDWMSLVHTLTEGQVVTHDGKNASKLIQS